MTGDDRARWTTGDQGNVFGRFLFERVSPSARPQWAGDVLAICQSAVLPIPEVASVLSIARDPDRWGEGHDVFDALRQQTLLEERSRRPDPLRRALLDAAETTAKIVYNASGRPAPFDYHAGWRLAPRAKYLAELVGEPGFEDRLWTALSQPLRSGA